MKRGPVIFISYAILLALLTLVFLSISIYFLFLVITISVPDKFQELSRVPFIYFLGSLPPAIFYTISLYYILKCRQIGRSILLYGIIPITLYLFLAIQKPRIFIMPQLIFTIVTILILNLKTIKEKINK